MLLGQDEFPAEVELRAVLVDNAAEAGTTDSLHPAHLCLDLVHLVDRVHGLRLGSC